MRPLMRLFVGTVILAAAAMIYVAGSLYPIHHWSGILLLCALAALAGNTAFELPVAATVSLGFAVTFAGIVYGGPLGGALVGLAGAASVQEIRERKPALLIVGNGAQLALAGGVAGLVYHHISAWPGRIAEVLTVGPIAAPILAATAFWIINVALVSVGVSLKSGMRPKATLEALGLTPYWVSLLVLALLGLVLAELLSLGSWWGLLLLILPFTAARRTFRVYVELSEAYTSTVRSLVAAIEAKDPYTRGHSERVAVYSSRLAESLGLSRPDVELLERAALLHDVGKIGIDLDTLTSPTQLAAEEVRAIRQHPVLGSELVGDVDFLSDIVPIVRHHHERIDGAGYPDGLVGGRIPVLARVLAVADAYDAMTSDRAYRPRMSREQALEEVARVSGTQLDSEIASRLASSLADTEGEVFQQ